MSCRALRLTTVPGFHFGKVERISIRLLEVRDQQLRVVDHIPAKHDAASPERRDSLPNRLAGPEADRNRSGAAGWILRRGRMQANRQPLTAPHPGILYVMSTGGALECDTSPSLFTFDELFDVAIEKVRQGPERSALPDGERDE